MNYFSSYSSRLKHAFSARPVAVLVTLVCVTLFILHARGTLKVDAYAIVLLALAALPWSLPAFDTVVKAMGATLKNAHITSFQIGSVRMEIDKIEKKLDEQRQTLDALQEQRWMNELVLYSMAFPIYEKLKHFHLGPPYHEIYTKEEGFDHDLRYLRDHGYLEWFKIEELRDGDDLVGKLKATEMGQRFVKLKEDRVARSTSSTSDSDYPQ